MNCPIDSKPVRIDTNGENRYSDHNKEDQIQGVSIIQPSVFNGKEGYIVVNSDASVNVAEGQSVGTLPMNVIVQGIPVSEPRHEFTVKSISIDDDDKKNIEEMRKDYNKTLYLVYYIVCIVIMASYVSVYTLILMILILPSASYMIHSKIRLYISVKLLKVYLFITSLIGSLAIVSLIFFLRKDINVSSFVIQFIFSIISMFMVGWLSKKYSQFIKFEKSHMLQFRRSRSNISP